MFVLFKYKYLDLSKYVISTHGINVFIFQNTFSLSVMKITKKFFQSLSIQNHDRNYCMCMFG